MKNFSKIGFIILAAFTFSVNAQMLNIKLENKVNQPEVSGNSSNAGADPEISPVQPTLRKAPFSKVVEFYEDSPKGDLRISVDYPTYNDAVRVAASNKSNFLHTETNSVIPYQIGDFERSQLLLFKDQPQKVSAIYKSTKGKSDFTVTLVPGNEATEGRLRDEYLANIRLLAKEKGKSYLPKPSFTKFRGIRYTINGVEGMYVNDEKSFSQVNVLECGSWMLVLSLNINGVDESQLRTFSEDLIRYFNPARLTAIRPMNLKPNVDFDREALKDTVVTGALVASAFKKIDWAAENVSTKERYAGFPDIYLNMHIESLKEYLSILNRKSSRSKIPENYRFYVDLKSINDAGYLAEFITEAYDDVVIVPNSADLDMNGYENWKRERELNIDLLKKKYKINYRALPY